MSDCTSDPAETVVSVLPPDILSLMRDDHQRLRAAFEEAFGPQHGPPAIALLEELWKHEQGELTVFWPTLRHALPSSDEQALALHGADHEIIDLLERIVATAGAKKAHWIAVLHETLSAHMIAEEEQGWQLAVSAISLEQLLTLGGRFLEAKALAQLPVRQK